MTVVVFFRRFVSRPQKVSKKSDDAYEHRARTYGWGTKNVKKEEPQLHEVNKRETSTNDIHNNHLPRQDGYLHEWHQSVPNCIFWRRSSEETAYRLAHEQCCTAQSSYMYERVRSDLVAKSIFHFIINSHFTLPR